jgi:hypothetical protein
MMDILTSGDLKGILEVLKSMEELEVAVADLYGTCAGYCSEDMDFWRALAGAEMKHAENIRKMIAIISKKPENFQKGRPFNVFATRTTISGIRNNIEKITKEQITKTGVWFIARDLEQSLMEQRYSDIVKTDDIEFLTLVREIGTETVAHKNELDRQISQRKK